MLGRLRLGEGRSVLAALAQCMNVGNVLQRSARVAGRPEGREAPSVQTTRAHGQSFTPCRPVRAVCAPRKVIRAVSFKDRGLGGAAAQPPTRAIIPLA